MNDPLKISFTPGGAPNHNKLFIAPEPAVRHVPEWYKSLAKHEIWNDEKYL